MSIFHAQPVRAALLFLHGSGDSGAGVQAWLQYASTGCGDFEKSMAEQGIAVVFPSAPPRPYSMLGGANSTVWFDR